MSTAEQEIPIETAAVFAAVQEQLNARLIGRENLVERMLIALLCGGHLLLEGAPGLAKTRAIKHFAEMLETRFSRIQATPDLLPSDLTGTTVFRQETGDFEFMRGPLFNHVILVDEINRAPPKVQSALLEAMAERQITVAGNTHQLLSPFLVAATQNPIEHEGTFPLPEAQLDRFLFFLHLAMPDVEDERKILDLSLNESIKESAGHDGIGDQTGIRINHAMLAKAVQAVLKVHISEAVRDYIVRLVDATRGGSAAGEHARHIEHPASPRGSIGLAMASRAKAWLAGRDHVLPSDTADLASDVLCGRIGLNYQARAEGIQAREIMDRIVADTPVV